MSDKPKVQYRADDFPGVNLGYDQHDLDPGTAQDQVNAMSNIDGQLQVRWGTMPVSFDYSTTGG